MNGRLRRLSTKPIGHTRDPSVATTHCTPPPTSCVVTVTASDEHEASQRPLAKRSHIAGEGGVCSDVPRRSRLVRSVSAEDWVT